MDIINDAEKAATSGEDGEDASTNTVALTDEQIKQFFDLASSEKYRSQPLPDDLQSEMKPLILDFVGLTPVSKSRIAGIYPAGADAMEYLQTDWAQALASGAMYLHEGQKVSFATRLRLTNGGAAEITIVRDNHDGDWPGRKPWVMIYVPKPFSIAKDDADTRDQAIVTESKPFSPLPDQPTGEMLGMRLSRHYVKDQVSSDTYKELASFSGPFSSFVFIPDKYRDMLIEYAGMNVDVSALLDRDFKTDLDNRVMHKYEGKVIFPVGILRKDGKTPVEVTIKHNSTNGGVLGTDRLPWFVTFVDNYVSEEPEARRDLETWAYLGPWDRLLEKLASITLPEMWDFDSSESDEGHAYTILKNYLVYTFHRLKCERKVLEDTQAGFAAFNTGLVSELYEPIFACFTSSGEESPAWKFDGFCQPASHGLGKQLVSSFSPFPERASYFTRLEDLLYDPSRNLVLDNDHILLDNIDRLPLEFLNDELGSNNEAHSIVEQLGKTRDVLERGRLFGELKGIVSDIPKLQLRLMNRLDYAKKLTLKRVEWNFRTAVPAFYPKRNTMSLLLPLDLTEDEQPDVALVVELTESGAYLGQTILTMRMAYQDARLICRPDSDWLNTSVKQEDNEWPSITEEE